MKKFCLLLVFLFIQNFLFCQFVLDIQHSTSVYAPVKLSSSGHKYMLLGAGNTWSAIAQTQQLKLCNLDGSVFKTLAVPSKPSSTALIVGIYYISDTLFDTDPATIEYLIVWDCIDMSSQPTGPRTKTQVVREDGTILLDEDHAFTMELFTTGKYYSVFKTEQGTRLELLYAIQIGGPNWQYPGCKIFKLPGGYPVGINPNAKETSGFVDYKLFPNPSSNGFSIVNQGSAGLNLEFYSLDGKKIKTYDVGPDMKVPDLGLPGGEYIIRANDQQTKQTFTKKIIIE